MLAGRATTVEMEILHAFAEDEPQSRHQQKKLQLCRWLKYNRAPVLLQFLVAYQGGCEPIGIS